MVPILCVLLGCDAGGVAVPVPLLDVPARVVLEAELQQLSFVEVPILNIGSGAAEVTAETAPPFQVSEAPFDIPADDAAGVLVSWTPDQFGTETGVVYLYLGSDQHDVLIEAVVLEDVDGDGFRDERAGGTDCDDERASVHPGAHDACGDGIDSNCDGLDPEC